MTFSRQFPAGATDGVTVIPAVALNAIDLNLSRAVDGNAGGTWVGAQTWTGGQTFNFCTVDIASAANLHLHGTTTNYGAMSQSGADARMGLRCATLDGSASNNITCDKDFYLITGMPGGGDTHQTLKHTGATTTPINGTIIHVAILAAHAVGGNIHFQRDDGGTHIAAFPANASPAFASFIYYDHDGANAGWHVLTIGGTATADAVG